MKLSASHNRFARLASSATNNGAPEASKDVNEGPADSDEGDEGDPNNGRNSAPDTDDKELGEDDRGNDTQPAPVPASGN